jgi:glycosyltransferase involved in cell wall biosynthesis
MRILLTVDPEIPVPPLLYGGIERIVDGIAQGLSARGHTVGLVAHSASTCRVSQLFPWPESRRSKTAQNTQNCLHLFDCVRRFRPDVVHSFSRLAYLLPLLAIRQPAVMSYQRSTGGARLRWASAFGGRRFLFTGCSQFIAGMGALAGGQWIPVPNFVDTDFYHFKAAVPKTSPLIFISRLERIKGVHTAIAIAKGSGRRLIIAGNRVDSPESRKYWEEEIAPNLQPGVIDYLGPVNDDQKNQLLGSSAALLVPIEWDEPFGIVFIEALACGTPVISCPRGALPEIIQANQQGFLINNIAEGIAAVNKVDSISRMSCRQRCENYFSREIVVSAYERCYCSVTKD